MAAARSPPRLPDWLAGSLLLQARGPEGLMCYRHVDLEGVRSVRMSSNGHIVSCGAWRGLMQ
jgi:hypothetical protein